MRRLLKGGGIGQIPCSDEDFVHSLSMLFASSFLLGSLCGIFGHG
jgi:hypothetical protein